MPQALSTPPPNAQGFVDEPAGQGFVDEPLQTATPPPAASATSRYLSGLGRTNPISTTYALAKGLWNDPKETVDQVVFQPVAREASLAKTAYQQGRPAAALGHAAGAIPLLGPPIAATVERAASGDLAGAAGEATGMAMTAGLVKPTAKATGRAALTIGREVPGVSQALQTVGERANRLATRDMAKALAPQSGPNKANLTAIAERIAPQMARESALHGVASRGGLVSAVEEGLTAAKEGLDQTIDLNPTLLQSLHGTQPILDGLAKEQGKLLVKGNKGAAVPAPRKAEFETLQTMIDDVKKLGTDVDYENLRSLRQAWDEPAAAAKIYAKSEAEFSQKAVGKAYANGASVLRDYLSAKSPEAAKANARYALYVNAHKVLRAADQASLTQAPSTGRALVARGTGLLIGRELGGTIGEIGGVLVAPLVDRALSSTKVGFQVKIAQHLAALSDAIEGGNAAQITQQVHGLRQYLPPMKTTLKLGAMQGRFAGEAPPKDQTAATPPPK